MSKMESNPVEFSLTRSEALVLFEMLTRAENEGGLRVQEYAEQVVLWNLEALLERVLLAPLQANYNEQLAEARRMLSGK